MLNKKPALFLWIFFAGLILVGESCTSSRSYGHDYTVNRSARSKSKVRRPVKRNNRAVAAAPKKNNRVGSSAVRAELAERNQIVDFAARYKGLDYQFGGKTPESGFDCSGLIYYTFRHFNYSMPAGSAAQSKKGRRIDLRSARAGDLLFFGQSGRVNHVALVTHNNGNSLMILHATSGGGVVEEDLNASSYWKKRYLFARNYIGQAGNNTMADRSLEP